MAEKGGFSLPTSGRSAFKSPVNGKDDGPAMPRGGRKVHFDLEDSLLVNGKAGTANGKGEFGKGEKGSKTGTGGKSMAKAPPPLELRAEQEVPESTRCLLDCEAAEILQGIQEHMVILSEDPTIKLPISFDRGLMYAQRHKLYTDPHSVRETLEPLKKHGVSDSEICMIANFHLESVDEVFALVPSLKGKRSKLREPLKKVLDELARLKNLA